MIDASILKKEESAAFALRSLYGRYGYLPFKMSKFEEYDLYAKNKDFLISDKIITFNDTNGKLLALKPDVTLSIIKNGEDESGVKQKVYYSENVYRVSGSTHQFKEIMQTGLECIGDIDIYDVFETLFLAASSLAVISDDFVLDVSHLGILSSVIDGISKDGDFKREIARLVSEKNTHDTERLCAERGVGERETRLLCELVSIRGDMESVLSRLSEICLGESERAALNELKTLKSLLEKTDFYGKIRFDFSIVNDMNYYNGIVFKGFVSGICESILSGGRYDKLMKRMGRRSGAIGFALYLDLLGELDSASKKYDVDTLLLYDGGCDASSVARRVAELRGEGKSVSAQREIPKKLRFKEKIDMRGGAAK